MFPICGIYIAFILGTTSIQFSLSFEQNSNQFLGHKSQHLLEIYYFIFLESWMLILMLKKKKKKKKNSENRIFLSVIWQSHLIASERFKNTISLCYSSQLVSRLALCGSEKSILHICLSVFWFFLFCFCFQFFSLSFFVFYFALLCFWFCQF